VGARIRGATTMEGLCFEIADIYITIEILYVGNLEDETKGL